MPAFNEERSIANIILGCKKYVDRVVIVDDGSEDLTASIAESLSTHVIRHSRNMGYGAALRSCFEAARELNADRIVILDCDGQHDPDEIPKLLRHLDKGYDIVIGSRFCGGNGQNTPVYRRAGMKVLDALTNAVGGTRVSDSQSGYRAYSRRAIERIQIRANGMSAGSEVLIQTRELGLKIAEVEIHCNYSLAETSTYNPVFHAAGIVLGIFKEAKRKALFGLWRKVSFSADSDQFNSSKGVDQ